MKIADLMNTIAWRKETRISKAGNVLYDGSLHVDRYIVDFAEDYQQSGWQQFDTDRDAWYFGVWVNPKTLKTLSYVEGDIHLIVCDRPEAYNREIQSMIKYYDEGFIAKTIDSDTGEVTTYRQDRSRFILPQSVS